jgi:hypothetical protein
MDWLLGGDAWSPGQLQRGTSRPRPASAAQWSSAACQPRMDGLLPAFGDALLGQDLAQLGMLVVHVSFPSCVSASFSGDLVDDWSLLTGSEWRRGVGPESGTVPTSALAGSPSLGADPLRPALPSDRSRRMG